MGATDEKKEELSKLLKSIAVSGSSFEAAELSEKVVVLTEELKEDSGVMQKGPKESE
jgi:hypothetical protein